MTTEVDATALKDMKVYLGGFSKDERSLRGRGQLVTVTS